MLLSVRSERIGHSASRQLPATPQIKLQEGVPEKDRGAALKLTLQTATRWKHEPLWAAVCGCSSGGSLTWKKSLRLQGGGRERERERPIEDEGARICAFKNGGKSSLQ